MKSSIFGILALVAMLLSDVSALPARTPNDDAEVVVVPLKSQGAVPDFKGVIDTGSVDPFLIPEPHPFSFNLGLFDAFDDIFRRLHTRLWPFAVSGPPDGSSEEARPGLPFDVSSKNGNTTSTVKIVDGHKIEINDTVYGDDKSIFKVRVVNIRPLDSEEHDDKETNAGSAGVTTSAPNSSADNEDSAEDRREPLDKSASDNEIKGNIDEPEVSTDAEMLPTTAAGDEAAAANVDAETESSVDVTKTATMTRSVAEEEEEEEERNSDSRTAEDSREQTDEEAAAGGAEADAEAAKLRQREDDSSSADVTHGPAPVNAHVDAEWGDFADANDLSNDIDAYDAAAPRDLSNDLAVNDFAAAQPGFALNPDAEFVDVDVDVGVGAGTAAAGPKFEKLSLGGAALNRTSFHQQSMNFK